MNADDYDPIAAAAKEDLGNGDITTDFFVAEALPCQRTHLLHANQLSLPAPGRPRKVFRKIDPATDIQIVHTDGDAVASGDVVIEVRGLARSILKAERVALNFLQRLCGIATLTRQFVDEVGNHPAKYSIRARRTPGLRVLERRRLSRAVVLITVLVYSIWSS